MNCPKCQHPMTKYPLDGAVVDYCDKCKGMWCDSTELSNFTAGLVTDNVTQMIQQIKLELAQERANPAECMHCPRCEHVELATRHINGLSVDLCDKCEGMFFDKGEFERYIHYTKPFIVKLVLWIKQRLSPTTLASNRRSYRR